jgi:hypothetical protein
MKPRHATALAFVGWYLRGFARDRFRMKLQPHGDFTYQRIMRTNSWLAAEVARLVEGYGENFHAHVERLGGYIPDSCLQAKPQTAIEAVAMRLTTEVIQDTLTRRRCKMGRS